MEIVSFQTNHKLLLQMIDIEFESDSCREEKVLELFDQVLRNEDLSAESKIVFSRRRLEFMEDFSSDITKYVYSMGQLAGVPAMRCRIICFYHNFLPSF